MAQGNYANVNGLNMYYEVHGTGQPLVLIHGAFSAIPSSFGKILPELAKTRQVIGVEIQGHGRTVDIDRPMRVPQLADDVAELVKQLGLEKVDVMGYSLGGSIALHFALRHPDLLRKLILMSIAYKASGIHPGLMDGLGEMQPEMMHGSEWHDEYMRLAPRPEDFNRLFAKKTEMDRQLKDITDEEIAGIKAPVFIILGDSDIATPEHAAEMFRRLGGGVFGDMAGLPKSQLAIFPGTMHTTTRDRADWLVSMINEFLDKPMPTS
jgi:pimeloyl-ACP methyl ester carboxylesterase